MPFLFFVLLALNYPFTTEELIKQSLLIKSPKKVFKLNHDNDVLNHDKHQCADHVETAKFAVMFRYV